MEKNKTELGNKIKLPEKLAFMCANFGNIPVMTIIGSYLLIFYTDVAMLDPVAVGVLFLVARIVDGINDPLVGYIIDHLPKVKMGRFRPWLIIGALLCSINFVILWLGPGMATSGKLVIAYISYLLLGLTFPGMDIPLNSVLPAMTDSLKERSTLATLKGLAFMVGGVIASMIVVPVISAFDTPLKGYSVLIVCVAAFVFLMSLIGSLGIHERIKPIKEEKYSVRTMFRIIIQTKPLLIFYAAGVLLSVGMFVRQGSMMYYATYNLNDAGLMVLLALTTVIGSLIGISFIPVMLKRFEKKKIAIASYILLSAGSLVLLFIPYTRIPLIIANMIITTIGLGTMSALPAIFQAEIIDYVELTHGYRAEGIVVSFNSFITKVGQALGGAIPAFVLSLAGYVPNAEQQVSKAILGINFSMTIIPAFFFLAAAIVFIAYPITTKKYDEITNALEEKRL